MEVTQKALEARARRAAVRAGLIARKSRWRVNSPDNFGDFRLVDASTNIAVAGERYDMTAQEVLDYCRD